MRFVQERICWEFIFSLRQRAEYYEPGRTKQEILYYTVALVQLRLFQGMFSLFSFPFDFAIANWARQAQLSKIKNFKFCLSSKLSRKNTDTNFFQLKLLLHFLNLKNLLDFIILVYFYFLQVKKIFLNVFVSKHLC